MYANSSIHLETSVSTTAPDYGVKPAAHPGPAQTSAATRARPVLRNLGWQLGAAVFCFLFGLSLIANNQMAGEATWFYCATLFNQGVKLYSGLHLVYQPLAILEMAQWIKLFGTSTIATEVPAVLFLLALCAGLVLLLRQSDWPDWQKAIVLLASFMLWISGASYRFDDYHVTTESLILYSVILLLLLAKTNAPRRQLVLTVTLGILCGLTITSRVNDGAALLASIWFCMLVLVPTRKILVSTLYAVISLATALAIILCTGDTFSAYVSSTITRATGTKGGSSTLLLDPILLISNSVDELSKGVPILLVLLVIVLAGLLVRRWKNDVKSVMAAELGLAALLFILSPHSLRARLLLGTLTHYLIPILVLVMYPLAIAVAVRYARWLSSGKQPWEAREILILIPLAQLVSISLSAAANPRSGYYAYFSVLLLLVTLCQPWRKQLSWANGSFLAILALLSITQIAAKATVPYSWDNLEAKPMFLNRQWYRHPVYGPMYIDRDLLQFSQSVCAEIGQGSSKPELLSLPLSYPNYFCDTPPWHGYLQTFFDTTAKSTMDKLMTELQTDPPQWIVYQRQLVSMGVQEESFNHGHPLPQRFLDTLIMQKIATHQWQLIDKKNYQGGDGWYIIRTHP